MEGLSIFILCNKKYVVCIVGRQKLGIRGGVCKEMDTAMSEMLYVGLLVHPVHSTNVISLHILSSGFKTHTTTLRSNPHPCI